MHRKPAPVMLALLLPLLLAGCVASGAAKEGGAELPPVPEEVAAIAAPWQDLTSARLMAADNCYWYEHRGPVETTMLPLRTPEGRPICAAAG